MHINSNVAISDSGFIFNPLTGDSFTTNPIGLQIIEMLKNGLSQQAIITEITTKYLVESSTVEKDLRDYLSMLNSYQLGEYVN